MSDSADLSHYIPRHLDDAPKFLFWDMDIAGIAVLFTLIGIAAGYTFIGLGVGIAAAVAYKKLKAGRHPGMANHLLYWFTGLPQLKALPPSHWREFNG